jgi:hypothetical protein
VGARAAVRRVWDAGPVRTADHGINRPLIAADLSADDPDLHPYVESVRGSRTGSSPSSFQWTTGSSFLSCREAMTNPAHR